MSRFVFLSDFLKQKFQKRVHKVSFRLNSTCPNRDGTISRGGCIFCNGRELIPFSYKEGMSPSEQILAGIEVIRKKYKAEAFIAYLQDNTATYGDEEGIIKAIYEVSRIEGVVGVSIGTRADCISDRFFDFFNEFSREKFLMIEIGVQSVNERTLRLINRGHSVDILEKVFLRLSENPLIHSVAHIILGLPDETEEDVQNTARWLNQYSVCGVKVHNLVVLRDTPLERLYLDRRYIPPEKERLLKYYDVFFKNLDDRIIIHRLTTDAPKSFIVAPDYAINKNELLSEIKRIIEEA